MFAVSTYHQVSSFLRMVFHLQNLGLIEESKISRSLPWRRPTNVFRVKEDVRPIFWYVILVKLQYLDWNALNTIWCNVLGYDMTIDKFFKYIFFLLMIVGLIVQRAT